MARLESMSVDFGDSLRGPGVTMDRSRRPYVDSRFAAQRLFSFRRFPSRTTHSFSDPTSQSDDLWDEQLDAIISGSKLQSVALTEDRRRVVWSGSVRIRRGRMCVEDDSTNLADRRGFCELVEKLRGINLFETGLTLVDLRATDFSGADLSGADLSRANLSRARFRRADFRESNLQETVLVGADLAEADFRGADLSRADFRQAILHQAILRWVDLRGADLTGANLFGANLERALLHEANFRGSNLRLASLNVTSFGGADLSEADLHGTGIRGADLGETKGLIQAQLESAKGDENTILPLGLVRPQHWAKTLSRQCAVYRDLHQENATPALVQRCAGQLHAPKNFSQSGGPESS